MIKRNRYSKEQKESLVLEILSEQTSMTEISKREGISVTTLSKWKKQFTSDGFQDKNKVELELRKKIAHLESALSDLIIENQILPVPVRVKKTEKLLKQYRQKEQSSKIASPQSWGSQGAAGQ